MRDDICAGLAYVGWHLEDTTLTRTSADAAIALGFPGWQPYFFGGIAYAIAPDRDRLMADVLLFWGEGQARDLPNLTTNVQLSC